MIPTVTEAPGLMTVPTLGRFCAVYGPVGGVTEVTVTGVSPPLVMAVVSGTVTPTGTISISSPSCSTMTNDRAVLVANSPVLVPSPMSGTAAASLAAAVVNVTGACSASPLCKVTGNVTGTGLPPAWVSVTAPTVNGAGVLIAVTC